MSAVGTGPLPTLQSIITRVKQTIISYKHNTAKDYDYVYTVSLVIYVCVILITIKRLTSDCLMHTKSVKY